MVVANVNCVRTPETELVESRLRAEFERVDAYRYNSASIRVRIVDARFAKLSWSKRFEMVEPLLDQLPEDIEQDILFVLPLPPDELPASPKNLEFEHPTPSDLWLTAIASTHG